MEHSLRLANRTRLSETKDDARIDPETEKSTLGRLESVLEDAQVSAMNGCLGSEHQWQWFATGLDRGARLYIGF